MLTSLCRRYIVLISDSESSLQNMPYLVSDWCKGKYTEKYFLLVCISVRRVYFVLNVNFSVGTQD